MDLLREYAHKNSQEAFSTLVARHVNMVYSVALRKTGNHGAAEEITQAVFVILAKKVAVLRQETILTGWLYHTARLTSASFLRGEYRRMRREQEAYMQSLSNEPEPELWPQIAPLLEDAMGRLRDKERDAIALRFFEGKSFQEIGAAVGATENAAKKRVAHGLEKLRKFFAKRGVVCTTTIIAGAVSANSVQAAPALLAASASTVAISKGAAASASTLTLIKGALKVMAWTKAKTAIVVGVVAILGATTTTVVSIKLVQAHRAPPDTTILSPTSMNATIDIQSDGTVHFRLTAEETNSTSRTATADSINDAQSISSLTDGSGKPMKFSKRPAGGYYIFPNKPVPPGGKVSFAMEAKEVAGLLESKGMGEYGVDFTGSLGNVTDAHLVQIWRLPIGAVLSGRVRGMEVTTNADRVELRVDKIIPPKGSYPVIFSYRLPTP